MNLVDVIALCLGAWMVFKGYQKGFISFAQLSFTLIVGISLSIYFSTNSYKLFYPSLVSSVIASKVIIFSICFILTSMISKKLKELLIKMLKKLEIPWMNHALGALLNLFLFFLILFFIVSFSIAYHFDFLLDPIKQSTFVRGVYSKIREVSDWNLAGSLRR